MSKHNIQRPFFERSQEDLDAHFKYVQTCFPGGPCDAVLKGLGRVGQASDQSLGLPGSDNTRVFDWKKERRKY